MRHKRFHAISI